MATTSNDLTTLDFASIKQNLKEYLKSQDIFQDYDFEGSNINVLLDILAYNTNLNSFYLNMLSNEMFLDSALLRDSIVSHAKELNYVPRSFRSATAKIDVKLRDTSGSGTVVIPRGTTFTGTLGQKNFTFSTIENVQAIINPDVENEFIASGVTIKEGDFVQDTYVTNADKQPRFIITNKTVDTNSIRVNVIEDNGENVIVYEKRDSLFGIGAEDQIYFLQAAENDTYEILFGDGVIGRQPKNSSIVLIEYRTCNGELPNGIRTFTADSDIGSASVTNVSITVEDGLERSAQGGSLPETLEEIKFNAPRAFSTQERVITSQDYATLLKAEFSEINDVAAFGGEEFDPPQFGRVIVAVDLKNTDVLPTSYKNDFARFLKDRSPLSIQPVFVAPNYSYVMIDTTVKYSIKQTSLGIGDIQNLVLAAIQNFNFNSLESFNATMRYSNLVTAIDNAQAAVLSNDTKIQIAKYIPITPLVRTNYNIKFDSPISAVRTDNFIYQGVDSFMGDNSFGVLNIIKSNGEIIEVGSVSYETGVVRIDDFEVSTKANLKVIATPSEADISANKNTILRVLDDDIKITIEQVNK